MSNCKERNRVLVMMIEVEVCEEGKLHDAVITHTDSEDHGKRTEHRYASVGEAFDHVLNNLLNAKMSAIAESVRMSGYGQVGNA